MAPNDRERLWLDDIEVDRRYRTAEYHLDADEIIEFAARFDPQPFHLSEQGAAGTLFETLAASGWHESCRDSVAGGRCSIGVDVQGSVGS